MGINVGPAGAHNLFFVWGSNMTYRICKALLWIFTSAIPIFLAACYGSPMGGWSFDGKVVDEETGKGINGILVSCIMTNGPMEWSVDDATTVGDYEDGGTYTSPGDGWYYIDYQEPCYALRFKDVDGPANYGDHRTLTVLAEDLTAIIELDRK